MAQETEAGKGALPASRPVFNRKKDVNIHLIDGGITVVAHMADNFHEMEVTLDISVPDMVIRDIRGRMIRTPHERCREALASLKGALGLEIKRGLTQRMEQTIGGKDGCSHLTNVVMEACHASVQGQYLALKDSFGDILDEMTPTERLKWFITMRPAMIDSCVAYRDDSPAVEEARRSPETERVRTLLARVAALYGKNSTSD